MSIVSLVIAPYIAVSDTTRSSEMHKMHHGTEMVNNMQGSPEMMKAMHKDGEKCSPEMMAAMHKDGKACSPEMMAAAKKAGMSCCVKPEMVDRFKN